MTETNQTDTTDHAGGPAGPSPELIEFREFVSQEAETLRPRRRRGSDDEDDGRAKAEAQQYDAHERIAVLSDAICARPAQSWADMIECAEVARYWQDQGRDGSLSGLASKYPASGPPRI